MCTAVTKQGNGLSVECYEGSVKLVYWPGWFLWGRPGMIGLDNYAAVRRFVFVDGHSRREAVRAFGLNPETVLKMRRFSLHSDGAGDEAQAWHAAVGHRALDDESPNGDDAAVAR